MSNPSEIVQNDQIIHESSTVRKINNLLNSSKYRIQGLELLNSFLPHCSDDDFLHFCIGWMQNCCKIDGLTKSRDFIIHLLRNLLRISSKYQELKKSVSFFITTRYFDFFFKYYLTSQAGWFCTETCLLLYRGACGPFQENLEKHLKNELNKSMKISCIISRCFALLPSIGGGGNDGTNYKKSWRNYFSRFLNFCQSLLNDLFVEVEFQVTSKRISIFIVQNCLMKIVTMPVQDGMVIQDLIKIIKCRNIKMLIKEYEILEASCQKVNEKSTEYLVIQLHNHSEVLICMLLNKYPTSKNIPSEQVLQLICRGLALIQKNTAREETAVVITLQKVLPDVHCIFLSLLKALIVTCKNQLLPYSRLICKLIKQSLKWTQSDFTYGYEKPLERVRISTYETLCNWLTVARNGSCIEVFSSVVSNAVNDIKSKSDVVFLKEAGVQNRSKSREQTTCWVDVAKSKLCFAAIKTLQFLLKFGGVLLKLEEHKFLQEVAVKLLVEVQKCSGTGVIVPFSLSACRIELYSLLLELVYHPCPNWPPPTNFALKLFSKGVNDISSQVSLFCSAALNFSTVIIHSQFDNGGFPLSETPENANRMEAELQWREPSELEKEKEPGENIFESDKTDSAEKCSYVGGESDASSDEDSRNTVTFLKDALELSKKNFNINGKKAEALPVILTANEPNTKKRRTSNEEQLLKKTSSPVSEKPPESDSFKKKNEGNRTVAKNAKSVSPESLNEESQRKARYFLRSKSKGSSEEPEEASKRASSPDSLKSIPGKSSASNQSSKKKARTKFVTNVEAESKRPEKNAHDDEDIKAAFNDSFVE